MASIGAVLSRDCIAEEYAKAVVVIGSRSSEKDKTKLYKLNINALVKLYLGLCDLTNSREEAVTAPEMILLEQGKKRFFHEQQLEGICTRFLNHPSDPNAKAMIVNYYLKNNLGKVTETINEIERKRKLIRLAKLKKEKTGKSENFETQWDEFIDIFVCTQQKRISSTERFIKEVYALVGHSAKEIAKSNEGLLNAIWESPPRRVLINDMLLTVTARDVINFFHQISKALLITKGFQKSAEGSETSNKQGAGPASTGLF